MCPARAQGAGIAGLVFSMMLSTGCRPYLELFAENIKKPCFR
jgi:hypothetical protein